MLNNLKKYEFIYKKNKKIETNICINMMPYLYHELSCNILVKQKYLKFNTIYPKSSPNDQLAIKCQNNYHQRY